MHRPAPFRPDTSWVSFLLASAAGLVILFVLLDPSPSRGLSTAGRAAFWAWHVVLPITLAQGVQVALSRFRPPGLANPWVAITTAGILGSALFVPLALAYDQFGFAPHERGDAEGFGLAAFAEEWISLAPPVTLVWLALNAARFLRLPAPIPNPLNPAEPQVTPPAPSFLDRLPPDRRGPLVALSAELHYLRVHTTRGDALILCNFGDALAELGGDPGVQVHRSHWVARPFIAAIRREGARTTVVTTTGLELPVSRSRRGQTDEWLQPAPPEADA